MPKNTQENICLRNVRVHNLKGITVELPANQLICFTGVSGSGKSSLAFDTLYVEGQRRYVESLSQHARRFLGDLPKPDLDSAEGITPTISIEQKTAGKNPRSTVGTLTEIYDYLRVLFARVGIPHCPVSGERVLPRSQVDIIKEIQDIPQGKRFIILAPLLRAKKGELKEELEAISREGFTRVRLDGKIVLLSEPVLLTKTKAHDLDVVVDRLEGGKAHAHRIGESVIKALELGKGTCIVCIGDNEEKLFSTRAYSAKSGISYPPLDPQDFSFNSPSGMCQECHGMGMKQEFDLARIIVPTKSIGEDCCLIAGPNKFPYYRVVYESLAKQHGFSIDTPWNKLSEKIQNIFLWGTDALLETPEKTVRWRGVIADGYRRYRETPWSSVRQKLERLMREVECPACKGSRLKPYPAATKFYNRTIANVCSMSIDEALRFFQDITLKTQLVPYSFAEAEREGLSPGFATSGRLCKSPEEQTTGESRSQPAYAKNRAQVGFTAQEKLIATEVVKEIINRLQFLHNVGLEYLQLERRAPTLSGGEAQRVRLASQIGSGLVGVTYVLDEPSIGLHPIDNKKLIGSLEKLRDKGNTVVVVEHDEETIRAANQIVDFGPKAGHFGGTIVYQGDMKGLLQCPDSLTGAYLSHKLEIPIPKKRRKGSGKKIILKKASLHNLKNIDVEIPLGCFIAVTGVSGSGKSSLFLETLFPALSNKLMKSDLICGPYGAVIGEKEIDKIIEIDQSPIGRTPRSNPATYIKVFDEIRTLYSTLPESQARGYKAGRFSFNVKEGSCPECSGMGEIRIAMDFLEDSWIECPTCHGNRFDSETLSIRYKEKNIKDVLDMDPQEAKQFFANLFHIKHKLNTLIRVGLDYIKLGQSSSTLSGGEAQRIKLARELSRPDTGKTLYILDEPTTGLHFHDMKHLLEVLHALVDKGNTVIVIEHNMDLVKTADWVIEMGPGSGDNGGKIIAAGTPEQLVKENSFPTSIALSDVLGKKKRREPKTKIFSTKPLDTIVVKGAEQNNLKNIDVTIPHNAITVCTGPSGAGKSSFAFETVFAEGQRRYVESLSPYIRQFVEQMPKPKVASVTGLAPSIAIERRTSLASPRSTVGTMTEIYDFLRIFWARVGIPHCPKTGKVIKAISKDYVVDQILSYPQGEKIYILAPLELKQETFADVIKRLLAQGYMRIRLNKTYYEISDVIPYDPKKKNELLLVIDRFIIDPSMRTRVAEAIESAATIGRQKLIVQKEEQDIFFNLAFAVEETGESYPEITPQTFAFNTPAGMCPDCQGLGFQWGINLADLPHVHAYSPYELILHLTGKGNKQFAESANRILTEYGIEPMQPLKYFSEHQRQLFMNGADTPVTIAFGGVDCEVRWNGLNNVIQEATKHQSEYETAFPEEWGVAFTQFTCPSCQGTRLQPLARHVTIQDKSLGDIAALPVDESLVFLRKVTFDTSDLSLKHVHEEIINRLSFVQDIGIGYLSLAREASTLSGGESQRIHLAKQIGSGLTKVLYVLDEPTSGLHAHDAGMLIEALQRLKAGGNTLLLVEHNPQCIRESDYIIEFGPESGKRGGEITAAGPRKEILANPRLLTTQSLTKKSTPSNKEPDFSKKISIRKATVHNLRSVDVDIPCNALTCLTGVSGSGKSTLLTDVLKSYADKFFATGKTAFPFSITGLEEFSHVVAIDQKPLGGTSRSDVASYIEVLAPIRELFAKLPQAKAYGYTPAHFSPYHRHGMCTACSGLGYQIIEMYFLPAVHINCPQCKGLRLNPESLSIRYKGKNVGEFLQMPIDEVRPFFTESRKICSLLDMMRSIGLGYLCLGQEIQTLSSGESQRVKLAKEIPTKRGKTLYLLDEPTAGLHPQEVDKLLAILHDLINHGHTIVAIEHNLDFIAAADYIIDLGPGAGEKGGNIIATGTPHQIMNNPASITGHFLKIGALLF